ncbi:MAG: hypothetical protein UU87_C0001G0037 [Parcubacteria group bacterium GW2011_GWA2_42_11]|nr:MAG: hypothetical protein UU87_C0001G0037 [Parcubacteria group bacterium GW2011_GWA2_42_11]
MGALKVLVVLVFIAVNIFFSRGFLLGDFDNAVKIIGPAVIIDAVLIFGGVALFIFF